MASMGDGTRFLEGEGVFPNETRGNSKVIDIDQNVAGCWTI